MTARKQRVMPEDQRAAVRLVAMALLMEAKVALGRTGNATDRTIANELRIQVGVILNTLPEPMQEFLVKTDVLSGIQRCSESAHSLLAQAVAGVIAAAAPKKERKRAAPRQVPKDLN